ncbi:RICIN domain-containing protein [Thermobifida halotolerans]|uniref:RICIN domain-containing protein n=3 Tax=Thermobifida halotolerans TaxID=483545 RepID=A0A399G4N8_9ACTN|nr:RICIN domain-containing protein [Thermobifida halotolerans]
MTARRRRPSPGRLLLAFGGVVALAAALLVVVARPAAAAAIDTDAYYVLVNRHSGKAMDVWEWSTDNGGEIRQYDNLGGHNQQFRFVSAGDGYYVLVNRHSGKAVDVWEHSTADGAEIRQYDVTHGHNQQFRVVDSAGGDVRLVNRNSGKALEVWEWSTDNGARLSQYTDHDGANQRWQLVRVDGNGGGGGTGECGSGSYHAEVTRNGGTWTARNGGSTRYTGSDMLQAMRAAVDSLTPGRTSKERVVVRGSGTVSAASSLDLPSHTVLEVCGTIDVTGSPSANNAVVRIRNAHNVEVPHITVTGSPYFGIFVRNASDVHFGQLDLRLSGGLGVRVDNHDNRGVRTRNVSIDHVYVSGTGNHGVETYGVDGLDIGTVVARDTAYSGLLLNDTINATVDLVDAENAGTGTGYAAFRMANRNGRVGDGYPVNIRVGEVRARGGGRGVFCVSESGGAVIDRIDLAGTGNNAILIENCYNVTLANQSGTVRDSGEIRIAARSEFPNTADVTIQNLTVTNTAIRESPCGDNVTFRNITRNNSSYNVC